MYFIFKLHLINILLLYLFSEFLKKPFKEKPIVFVRFRFYKYIVFKFYGYKELIVLSTSKHDEVRAQSQYLVERFICSRKTLHLLKVPPV